MLKIQQPLWLLASIPQSPFLATNLQQQKFVCTLNIKVSLVYIAAASELN